MMELVSNVLMGYSLAVTGGIGMLLTITMWNLLRFRRMSSPHAPYQGELPLVSVLIPARNEERGIEACVRSICEQDYASLEVVVLDDGSTDATPSILERLCGEFQHLRVIKGTPLPEGWVGKVWACHQLSEAARGDVLIFTDADTHHAPQTVSSAVRTLQREKLDFFSIITHQELGTLGEHLVIPVVHMLFFSHLPSDLVMHHPSVKASAANGQFMCFTRQAYMSIGGHRSVRTAMVEDVSLARVMKSARLKIGLLDGIDYVSCRMYTSAREVTDGFSKNFFAGTNYNVPVMIALLLFFFCVYVMPYILLGIGLWMWETNIALLQSSPSLVLSMLSLPLTQILLAMFIRGTISLRFRMPMWHAVVMPISALWVVYIGLRSMQWAFSSTGTQWKGRSYSRPTTDHA
jgi:chlorobactene glucosyltransferase